MNRLFLILLEVFLAFICLLAFGQFYSWFYTGALIAMAVYAVLLAVLVLHIRRSRKKGDDKAAGRLHLLLILLLILPPFLAFLILLIAFSAMAIYG